MLAHAKHITVLLAFVLAIGGDRRSSLPAAPADQPVATTQHMARAAGLSASGNTYRVMRTDRVWKVTEDRMNWIA